MTPLKEIKRIKSSSDDYSLVLKQYILRYPIIKDEKMLNFTNLRSEDTNELAQLQMLQELNLIECENMTKFKLAKCDTK